MNIQAHSSSAHQLRKPLVKNSDLTWRMHATQDVKYSISVVADLLDPTNPILAQACGRKIDNNLKTKRLAVIDSTVYEIYGEKFKEYFNFWNFDIHWKIIPGDEINKNVDSVIDVTQAMSSAGLLRRGEVVIGIGGGVLLDVVGFASSLYRRGIPYVRIPTTLMGQIDAGIGIKTGINHGEHKNRLGTYFAPSTALIDPIFLKSLDQRHISNGVAEIIKMALIKDHALFELLEVTASRLTPEMFSSDDPAIREIMSRAIAGMLAELEPNLWEAELARCVDYGHTFSPSLELIAAPALLHGEAVAVDMALCIALANGRGLITQTEAHRAIKLIHRSGLPIAHAVFQQELLERALVDTVKHRDGLQRIPLTDGIGAATFVNDLTAAELAAALTFIADQQRIFERDIP
ncbi:sedoheptulose 7-phosphate cyclase [Agrobacterium sp. rho-13.3]|uniref:sedoheptulose 7-phosphate cyclase n=1 Tax=Agrobacterium sp. rho-13.3 TaxID=3072980 RepID=UPI002A100621|nr:sedoheptulose 7-phosphate cyclase [Agrobacterium sp. rho-13.3]MDX8308101.1 sedoheptulose 7-phosphate cyclase [Agrobacterium sp. rho-13.3]